MKLRFTEKRSFSKPIAAAILALGLPMTAGAEGRLQLHVPHSFAATPAPTEADSISDEKAAAEARTAGSYGEVEIVRERYPNGNTRIERQVTLDQNGNYVNHGTWKMLNTEGAVIAEGQYDMGKRVGHWTRWFGRNEAPALSQFPFKNFKAPFASQITFTDDVMDGDWLISDAEQQKCMQISLSNGKRHGTVTTWTPNGKTYRQATYDQGVPVGDVMEADAKTGELKRTATYLEGRKIITKTANYKSNAKKKKTEELYLAATTVEKAPDDFWNLAFADYVQEGTDLRHGPSKAWFENGHVQWEGYYQYDKKEGGFTYWYQNGQIAATGEYKSDVPEDIWVWWHENGQKAAVGKYTTGALIGDWRWWSEDGKLADQKTYDGSKQIGSNPQDVIKLGRAPSADSAAK